MVTHRAQQLEDLRLAERQRGSPRREAVANLPGSPSLERVASKIEVAPVKACQVARLPGCLVHTIGSLQPAAAHASAICERSPLLALRVASTQHVMWTQSSEGSSKFLRGLDIA